MRAPAFRNASCLKQATSRTEVRFAALVHAVAIASVWVLSGCTSLGPTTIVADRFDVPEEHLAERSALPGVARTSAAAEDEIVRIRCGKAKSVDAYVAVRYRDYWFWIDQGDLRTKRALNAVMQFFTLVDTGSKEAMPLITIPAR